MATSTIKHSTAFDLILGNDVETTGTLTKDINIYDFLILVCSGTGGAQFTSTIIPKSHYNKDVYADVYQSQSVYAYGTIKVNDTTITVTTRDHAGWSGFKVRNVYGVKL